MPDCIMCGESTFNEFDGNFFCINCGTQTQVLSICSTIDMQIYYVCMYVCISICRCIANI